MCEWRAGCLRFAAGFEVGEDAHAQCAHVGLQWEQWLENTLCSRV